MRRALRTFCIALIALPIGLAVSLCNADVASYVARRVNLFNGEWITSVNAAGTGTNNLIRSNASNYTDINGTSFIDFLIGGTNESFIANDAFVFDSGTNFKITTNTGDGADTGRICMLGAGTSDDAARGAYVCTNGNEVGSGRLYLGSGSAGITTLDTANFYIRNVDTSIKWLFDASGNISGDATNGGRIYFQRALRGVSDNMGTLAAAGSTQTDAAALPTTVTRVTGANGTVGVKLPAIGSAIVAGQEMTIINSSTTSVLKLYSAAAGELITGQAGTTAISMAAKTIARCRAYDATNWYCGIEGAPY